MSAPRGDDLLIWRYLRGEDVVTCILLRGGHFLGEERLAGLTFTIPGDGSASPIFSLVHDPGTLAADADRLVVEPFETDYFPMVRALMGYLHAGEPAPRDVTRQVVRECTTAISREFL
jgi:hypothetical protein